jgi:beta-lactamase class A
MKLRKLADLGAILLIVMGTSSVFAQRPQEALFKDALAKLTTALGGFKEEYTSWFVPDFFKTVPREQLVTAFQKSHESLGAVQRTRVIRITEPYAAEVEFISATRRRLYAVIRLESKPPHRFTYVFFSHLDTGQDSWDRLLFDVQKFPGQTAASVWRLTPRSEWLLSHNADVPLAVGSSFKLMLLSTLVDEIATGKRKWDEVVKLREAYRSLPSGMLHDWPPGSPVTLHTLAALMMARSDNTAADHLFHSLGRAVIESHQVKAKVQAPERNRPFLCTAELFKLKLVQSLDQLKQYAAADEAGKRRIVELLSQVSLSSPRTLSTPLLVDQVEWFFTTDDLCRLLEGYRQSKVEVLPLLAITRPFEIDEYEWDFLGFKGGAEAGALNLSLIGKRKGSGDWFAFAFTWNRVDQPLDESSWLRILDRAVRLAEREAR